MSEVAGGEEVHRVAAGAERGVGAEAAAALRAEVEDAAPWCWGPVAGLPHGPAGLQQNDNKYNK